MSLAIRNTNIENEKLFEKVILQNDLSGLSPLEKVEHIKNMCISLGLNPLTKPIQLHKFDGKEIPYMSKDGTEQLRNIHDVSITKLETEIVNESLYIVKAYAQKPNGRVDCSTSVQTIGGLKGKLVENAMKKCETQAKRRVTLSICGLGMLDETEIGDIPAKVSRPVNLPISEKPKKLEQNPDPFLDESLLNISQCKDMDELQAVYTDAYKYFIGNRDKESVAALIKAKDEKKKSLEDVKSFDVIDNSEIKGDLSNNHKDYV